jgi:hypothetical protein
LIAAIFLILGVWCLIAPSMVLSLGTQPGVSTGSRIEVVLMGCFGAQAVLAGLFAATARFTRTTFFAYGVALLPFFAFNYWFWQVEPLFNATILLDVLGNVVMLALCVVGYRAIAREAPPA